MSSIYPTKAEQEAEEELQSSGNPDPFHFFQEMLFGGADSSSSSTATPPPIPSDPTPTPDEDPKAEPQAEEAEEEPFDLDKALDSLKSSPAYEKLKSQLIVLTPAQQKAAVKFALKCQDKAKQKRMEKRQSEGSSDNAAATPLITHKSMQDHEILDATRFGEIEDLQRLLTKYNRDVHTKICARGDAEEHPLLHWAVLDDEVELAQWLLDAGVDLHFRNPRGETAIHWACLRGQIRSVHLLMQYGADLKAGDARGYTPMHHAAQFGQTVVMAMLHKNGCVVDVRDADGRTPLHWAVYKNEQVAAQWLITHGADVHALDWEDCMPMHWAALQGLRSMAALLVKHGDVNKLKACDKTGKTARELAYAKGEQCPQIAPERKRYMRVAGYLRDCEKAGKDVDQNNRGTKHFTWFLWPVLAPPGWYQYYYYVFPATFYFSFLTFLMWTSYWGLWVSWIILQFKDPGFIVVPAQVKNGGGKPKAAAAEKEEVRVEMGHDSRATVPSPAVANSSMYRDMYEEVLDKGLLVPVCSTCEIVRPLRSKHDRFTNRCVEKFDHYCPWIGTAVGARNYKEFFCLIACGMVSMNIWIFFVIIYTYRYNEEASFFTNFYQLLYWEAFAWMYFPIALYAVLMTAQHAYFVVKNLTTNEMMNQHRYEYLKRGRNPFSRGYLMNTGECLGTVTPVSVDLRTYHRFLFDGNSRTQQQRKEYRQVRKTQGDRNNISVITN